MVDTLLFNENAALILIFKLVDLVLPQEIRKHLSHWAMPCSTRPKEIRGPLTRKKNKRRRIILTEPWMWPCIHHHTWASPLMLGARARRTWPYPCSDKALLFGYSILQPQQCVLQNDQRDRQSTHSLTRVAQATTPRFSIYVAVAVSATVPFLKAWTPRHLPTFPAMEDGGLLICDSLVLAGSNFPVDSRSHFRTALVVFRLV